MGLNIFEIINSNIVALSEDLLILHRKVDEMYAVLYPQDKIECVMQAIYDALYPQELPNADGEVLEESEVISDHD